MKALAIIALAVALEAGFLLSALLPPSPPSAAAAAVARPAGARAPATAASSCLAAGPRC